MYVYKVNLVYGIKKRSVFFGCESDLKRKEEKTGGSM